MNRLNFMCFRNLGAIAFALGVAVLVSVVAGCASDGGTGYMTGSLFPGEVKTIRVPVFENKTYHTGVERQLTDAVIKELQARTPYRVTQAGAADTLLTATVVSVETVNLTELRGSGLVEEQLRSITIDFVWKDIRTGRILSQREIFTTSEEYIPSMPVGERPDIGNFAVADKMATHLVDAMQGAW